MTKQHTPGPWIHNPRAEPQNADRHICVNIPSGFARVIALVKQTAVDDAVANARLIAAAPEMYDFLAHLDELWTLQAGHKASLDDDRARLRALLAKIEGGAL